MPTFEQIKRFYELGLWNADMVQKTVDKGIITAEQKANIVD